MNHLFIANWKMNLSLKEAEVLCREIDLLRDSKSDIIICSPELYILPLKEKFSSICFANQNVSEIKENFGAYTGETSAYMLAQQGIKYAIIGHSERRKLFGETNETVKAKAENCLQAGLTPIICLGEDSINRKKGDYLEFIGEQILHSISKTDKEVIIAYEPIWSIGTGVVPTSEQIKEVARYIGKIIEEHGLLENGFKLVYGGSVSSENIRDILSVAEISGVLIGKASLDREEFFKIFQGE
jgi:triosephosphate isomerase (TIM)